MRAEASSAWHRAFSRTGLGTTASVMVGAVSGLVSLWVLDKTGRLYFDNGFGPLGHDPGSLGRMAGPGLALLAATVVFAATWWLASRSQLLALVLVLAVCAGAWVLQPRLIDIKEGFAPEGWPQINPRWSCTGWSWRYAPPEAVDHDLWTFCVGLEKRISDG